MNKQRMDERKGVLRPFNALLGYIGTAFLQSDKMKDISSFRHMLVGCEPMLTRGLMANDP